MPDTPKTKAYLFEKISTARNQFLSLIDSLTDTQLTTPGVHGAWSAKDILAHLAAWERLTVERLNAGLESKPLPFKPIKTDEDVEWMNERVYAIQKSRPLEDVLDDFHTAHKLLLEKIEGMDKLIIQYAVPMEWAGGRPVWRLIADNTYLHYTEHQEAIATWLARTGKWVIRAETGEDNPGVRRVEELAFGRPDEANIVDGIRSRGGVILSLMALEEDEIIGHILFSPVTIVEGDRVEKGVALGPVAVLPSHQKLGVGSRLCWEGLAQLREMGHKIAVVLGHSEYYPRFGFQPGEDYGVRCPWDVPPEVFMVMELQTGALEGVTGMVTYLPEFG
jgi:putative acetyltransferase